MHKAIDKELFVFKGISSLHGTKSNEAIDKELFVFKGISSLHGTKSK